MKKILCAVMAVLCCLAVVGCSSSWTSNVKDFAGEVSSNGGFLVEKGDYIYFVNGVEDSTATNDFGTPIKGSLVRMKKADLALDNPSAEVVIPKLVYSAEMKDSNGVFIFGDYVYYTTPCSEKNKKGEVRNTELEFVKTKLDGTDTKVITTLTSNSTPYRFVKSGETVYLIVYTTDADSKNVMKVFDADAQKEVLTSNVVSSYLFSDDLNATSVYYVSSVESASKKDENESFNQVRRINLSNLKDEAVFLGAGTYTDATYGIGISGVTFTIIRDNGKQLFFSETNVDTSSGTVTMYYGINQNEIVTEDAGDKKATAINHDKIVLLNKGDANATSIFATTSIYISLDAIIYFDTTYGIIRYNYTLADGEDLGRVKLYYDTDILNNTFSFMKDGYVYETNASGTYFRFNLAEAVDLTTGEKKAGVDKLKVTKLNYFAINTSWFPPEIVGNYMLVTIIDSPYNSYVYKIDMTATDEMDDDEISEYSTEMSTVDKEHIESRIKTRIGIVNEADKESYTTYMNENYNS